MESIYRVDSVIIMTYSSVYYWQYSNDNMENLLNWVI